MESESSVNLQTVLWFRCILLSGDGQEKLVKRVYFRPLVSAFHLQIGQLHLTHLVPNLKWVFLCKNQVPWSWFWPSRILKSREVWPSVMNCFKTTWWAHFSQTTDQCQCNWLWLAWSFFCHLIIGIVSKQTFLLFSWSWSRCKKHQTHEKHPFCYHSDKHARRLSRTKRGQLQ